MIVPTLCEWNNIFPAVCVVVSAPVMEFGLINHNRNVNNVFSIHPSIHLFSISLILSRVMEGLEPISTHLNLSFIIQVEPRKVVYVIQQSGPELKSFWMTVCVTNKVPYALPYELL